MIRIKKKYRKIYRADVLFLIALLFLPFFFHILNTYVLGFYNLLFTFEQIDSEGNTYWVGFQNFVTAWNMFFSGDTSILLQSLKNSLLIWGIMNLILFPVTIILSFYMSKQIPGHKFFRFVALVPQMVTGLIMAFIYRSVMEGLVPQFLSSVFGLDFIYFFSDPEVVWNTLVGFMIWTNFGYTLIVYPNAMNAIDKSIVEASQIDGANDIMQLWHVYIPGIWPTITVMFLSAIGGIFAVDVGNFVFFGYSAPFETMTLSYYIFQQTMKGGDRMAPVLNALTYMMAAISIPLSLTWKYVAENYGPGEDEIGTKKKLIDTTAGR